MDIPTRVKAVIRYILNPYSPEFRLEDLTWATASQGMIVYRGQCNVSTKNIPRLGENPLQISTTYNRPISTSLVLNQHIEQFACAHPGGRIFEIHITPGVRYSYLRNSLRGFDVNRDEVFQFLKDELPAGNYYKTKSLGQIRAAFFGRLSKEQEVVLDPRGIVFTTQTGAPESWSGPMTKTLVYEVDTRGKPTGMTRLADVYRTYVVPQVGRGRRGRSLRTHSTRRNKNGRGSTRKSQGRRHGRY